MITKRLVQSAVAGALIALTAGAANAAACSVQDVTFSSTYPDNQQFADACSNALDGTGNTPNLPALANLWGPNFVEGVTLGTAANGTATGGANVLGGFQFTLSGITATIDGVYTLTIEDTNGATAPNLPFYLDFVLYLKGGGADTAAYLFDDTLVDEVGGGVWEVTFLNNGGNNPELSNTSVYVREGTVPPDNGNGGGANGNGGGANGNGVPEPATLALVGMGLLGAAAARRRQRS